jgi:hypothetical protein
MGEDHFVTQETGMNVDWLGVFEEYDVEFIALDLHGDSELVNLCRSQPGWTVDFEDGEAVIFVRADAAQPSNFSTFQPSN